MRMRDGEGSGWRDLGASGMTHPVRKPTPGSPPCATPGPGLGVSEARRLFRIVSPMQPGP